MIRAIFVLLALVGACAQSSLVLYAQAPKIDTETIVSALFKLFKLDLDASECVSDSTGIAEKFSSFSTAWQSHEYQEALGELSQGLSAISASISNCGVGQIAHVLDGAAIAVKFAKLSASVDKIDSVIMGASELRDDIEDIASASASGDADALATALSSFLSDWSQVIGDCGASGATMPASDAYDARTQHSQPAATATPKTPSSKSAATATQLER